MPQILGKLCNGLSLWGGSKPRQEIVEALEMDDVVRSEILSLAGAAHDLTESSYQENSSTRGDAGWGEKQRVLLADMALHLLQTALREGELSEEHLKRNLFSILTISDQLMPGNELKAVADKLYSV